LKGMSGDASCTREAQDSAHYSASPRFVLREV
jgi:hypothetical protein